MIINNELQQVTTQIAVKRAQLKTFQRLYQLAERHSQYETSLESELLDHKVNIKTFEDEINELERKKKSIEERISLKAKFHEQQKKIQDENLCICEMCITENGYIDEHGLRLGSGYFKMCKCGNKRCPHRFNHNIPCTKSNEVIQSVKNTCRVCGYNLVWDYKYEHLTCDNPNEDGCDLGTIHYTEVKEIE